MVPAVTQDRADPFDQLLAAVQTTLQFVSDREGLASDELTKRAGQRVRLEAALAILTSESPPRKSGGGAKVPHKVVWTPEMRQAASERMRSRHAEGTGAFARKNGHDGAAPLVPAPAVEAE
jgi:hypothetical protein